MLDAFLLLLALPLLAAGLLLVKHSLRRRPAPARGGRRRAFEAVLDIELERARRHERPLTLVRLSAARRGTAAEELQSLTVRRTDTVHEVGSVAYLIAPETDAAEARILSGRLAATLDDPLGLVTATATFPDDGVSSGALLAKLDARRHPETARPPRRQAPRANRLHRVPAHERRTS